MRAKLNLIEEPSTFVSSGCFMLDLVLGGGWGRGRIINLVGDKSSGKTLLAVEACANFSLVSGPENIRYLEAESAFDENYADIIGMPKGVKIATGIERVEGFYKDLSEFLKTRNPQQPSLYVVDSLDAMSDDAEMEKGFAEGSYGTSKARQLSKLFRQLVGDLHRANCTLLIISQIRDKIGVVFGEKHTRSGGRALDFYASQIVWLSETGKIRRTIKGVDRVIGIRTLARTKKNKLGLPFRQAELALIFRYGIDDEETMLDWLQDAKAFDENAFGQTPKELRNRIAKLRADNDRAGMYAVATKLRQACRTTWEEIESRLEPGMRKYE
jgi:recombination protein RecA